ncbi:hypothetical protein HAX54_010063 [Datura stramonium]|uniref:Uncharacterized protein n=1 Tax=Datura stramonium TaxID=4076 RepID=A0ABS8THM9_DATST|nr:hypothetical protein [Datura stramonium]
MIEDREVKLCASIFMAERRRRRDRKVRRCCFSVVFHRRRRGRDGEVCWSEMAMAVRWRGREVKGTRERREEWQLVLEWCGAVGLWWSEEGSSTSLLNGGSGPSLEQ